MSDHSLLLQFKNLEITRSEAEDALACNLLAMQCSQPILIHVSDVINAISAMRSEHISMQQLIDWVNVVWFSDIFDYADGEDESIASVMNVLEALDEPDIFISQEVFDEILQCLSENRCYDM